MFTLIDVLSQLPKNEGVRAMAIRKTLETSPMMSFMQFVERPNLTSTFFIEGDLTDVDYRAYNDSAPLSAPISTEEVKTELFPLADRMEIDPLLADVRTRENPSYIAEQIKRRFTAFGLNFKRAIVGKNFDPLRPKGLYGWINYYNSATNQTVIDVAGAATSILTLGATAFIQKMGELTDATLGLPFMYLTNRNIIRQIDALTIASPNNTALAMKFAWKTYQVLPGIEMRYATWEDRPLVPVDQDALRAEIMPFDETFGASNLTSSILAVRIGEEDCIGLQRDMSGPIIRDYLAANTKRVVEIDWPNGMEVRNYKSAARLRGILAG